MKSKPINFMDRTVSQTARVLETDIQQVKTWAWLFKDHLSTGANPGSRSAPKRQRSLKTAYLLLNGVKWS